MAEVLSSPALYTHIGGCPPTTAELTDRYRRQLQGGPADGSAVWRNSLIVLDDVQLVGYVQATIPSDGAATEIAWVVGRPWQGRGIARQAVALLVDELRGRGVSEVIAHIHPGNLASQALARRIGMHETAIEQDGERRWSLTLAPACQYSSDGTDDSP